MLTLSDVKDKKTPKGVDTLATFTYNTSTYYIGDIQACSKQKYFCLVSSGGTGIFEVLG